MQPSDDKILILDFGSQYTQLIARRVRELGVYSEIHPWDWTAEKIRGFSPKGIIFSGGPETASVADGPRADAEVYDMGVPILGICYGMQTMAAELGGRVVPSNKREFGYARVARTGACRLLDDIEDAISNDGVAQLDVWMSHGDRVEAPPSGFSVVAGTESAPVAGIADDGRSFYGLQFHPEVTHTVQGARILGRFVHDICGCGNAWQPGNIIESLTVRVREQVGAGKVLLGLSGGVDSSVVAALL
ncbi:glutamine-hydrolyzing GMP synthase, partial [uncultured Abyssibacter sp.]|uniref:glutamine-hydrolyzing GMP synthase n=1 Tax=uncultured Abyssibacter sp. TaxID=2320202 RepID=UPI0032B1F5D1